MRVGDLQNVLKDLDPNMTVGFALDTSGDIIVSSYTYRVSPYSTDTMDFHNLTEADEEKVDVFVLYPSRDY